MNKTKIKDITPHNKKGQRHGYWEYYFFGDILFYKCFYQNDKEVGYEEDYDSYINGKLTIKTYHI